MRKLLLIIITSISLLSCTQTPKISDEDNRLWSELEEVVNKTEYIYVENYDGGVFIDDGIDDTLEVILHNNESEVDGMGQVLFLNPSDVESVDDWLFEAAKMRVASKETIRQLDRRKYCEEYTKGYLMFVTYRDKITFETAWKNLQEKKAEAKYQTTKNKYLMSILEVATVDIWKYKADSYPGRTLKEKATAYCLSYKHKI